MKKPIVLTASCLIGVLASLAAACATAAPPSVAPAPTTLAVVSPTVIALPAATPTPASSPTAVPPTTTATAAAAATATALPMPSATPTLSPTVVAEADITTTGAFFSLSVADLKASTQWYSEKLGLKVVLQPPKTHGAAVVALEGGGLIVELIQVDGSQPLAKVAPGLNNNQLVQGIVKVGAIVENFDQTVALLRARHVTIVLGPYPASADQRANIIVQDNAGNLIQFFGK